MGGVKQAKKDYRALNPTTVIKKKVWSLRYWKTKKDKHHSNYTISFISGNISLQKHAYSNTLKNSP